MHTYISMLRGINVSGQKKIKMADLRALYESLGFLSVQTYIQSGNVVFDSKETDEKRVARSVANAIKYEYGFEVPVVIRNCSDLQKIVKDNPLLRAGDKDISKLHVTFLSDRPAASATKKLDAPAVGGEELSVVGREVYLYCPNGYGKSKLTNNFFEKTLSVAATTRNWKTVNTLLEMVEGTNR